MKKLVIILCSLLGILLVGIGILLWNINPILETFKPQIISAISKPIGKPVKIQSLEAQFFPNIAIEVRGLSLADTKEQGAFIEQLLLSTSLGDLLKGQVSVSELSLRGVTLVATKKKNGKLNIGGITLGEKNSPQKNPKTSSLKTSSSKEASPSTEEGKDAPSISFALNQATLRDLNFTFIDQSGPKQKEIKIQNLGANIQALPKTGAFDITLEVLGEDSEVALFDLFQKPVGENFSFTLHTVASPVGPIAEADTVLLKLGEWTIEAPVSFHPKNGLKAKLKSERLALSELEKFVPLVQSFGLTGALKPDIAIEVAPGAAFPKSILGKVGLSSIGLEAPANVSNLSGTITFEKDNHIRVQTSAFEAANLQVDSLSIHTQIAETFITIHPSTVKAYSGKLAFSGKLNNAGDTKHLSVDLRGAGIALGDLMGALAPAAKYGVEGTLSQMSLRAKTYLSKPIPTLTSTFSAVVTKGAIGGVNIMNETLGKINSIPGVGGSLLSFIPEKYQPLLQQNSTAFDTLELDVSIASEQANLQKFLLGHVAYIIDGTGQATFHGSFQIAAQFRLTPQITSEMIVREPKLKLLTDKNGNLVVPVLISRKGESLRVIPNTKELLKNAARSSAKEAVGRELERVAPGLGGAKNLIDSLF